MTEHTKGPIRQDTRTILRVATPILVVGVLCWIYVALAGGLTAHGPSNTGGWMCLMVGLGCTPTGLLFLLIGIGKVFEDRKRQP